MVKQLKNRYNDPTIYKRFIVGIDRGKMRLYDCEQSAQEDIVDTTYNAQEPYKLDNDESKYSKKFSSLKF